MATRAFLLCTDEKAVHAISQILDELEVSFEHSSEPPFALKRLPAQRFDLLIVDCDNTQNATQVFNSARASSLNKNSIAIAIVEGKAGVPNAFRLGASLVLTKPVSLEQARNTLRTGVGMTKKDGPETKAPAAAPTIPHATTAVPATPPAPVHVNPPAPQVQPSAAPTPVPPHVVTAPPVAASPVLPPPAAKIPAAPIVPAAPAPVTSSPAASSISPATASADTKPTITASVEKPVVAPKAATVAPPPTPEAKPVSVSATETKVPSITAVTPAAKAAAAATSTASTALTSTSALPTVVKAETASSALSATSDKKPSDVEKKSSGSSEGNNTVLKIEDPLADELDALDPLKDHGVPSFGALSREPFAGLETEKPRRSKLPLVAALVLVLLGGGAYAAWLTQPNFRALMISEFGNAKTKLDTMRGKDPVTTAAQPQPAPVAPAPVQPAAPVATQNSENIDVSMTPNGAASDASTDPTANNAPATTPADTTTNSTGTSTTGNASTTKGTEPAAAAPATATKAEAPKQPKLQSAKQDSTPGKSAALVPASLPPATTAKAPSSDLLEVPEDFADDQVIHRVHPTYPKQALTKKLHGSVTLQVIVNKQGKVDSLALVSGDPVLGQAAQSAVKQWRYKPYWHNGEPTDFQTHVTVDFKLP